MDKDTLETILLLVVAFMLLFSFFYAISVLVGWS